MEAEQVSDPFVGQIKASIGGLSEVISLADDLDGVAQQVSDLGKKELAARRAWRSKQVKVNGDYAFVDAVDEYKRVKEAQELRDQMMQETIRRWGPGAWDEVLVIEARQKDERQKLYTEDGHDREAMFKLKLWCFGLAACITLILWLNGTIHEMAVAFYGE